MKSLSILYVEDNQELRDTFLEMLEGDGREVVACSNGEEALATWQDITPLARSEWICWIESAKKLETRRKRIDWGCSNLSDGKRRPSCWPGCPHR